MCEKSWLLGYTASDKEGSDVVFAELSPWYLCVKDLKGTESCFRMFDWYDSKLGKSERKTYYIFKQHVFTNNLGN